MKCRNSDKYGNEGSRGRGGSYAMAEREVGLSYREGRKSIRLVSRDGGEQATGSE